MFTDLFSSLDGTCSYSSWILPLSLILLFLMNRSFNNFLLLTPKSTVSELWKNESSFFNSQLLLASLMLMFICFNLAGLVPFVYGVTTSLWFNVSIALTIWLSAIISGTLKSFKDVLAHLVPFGAPGALTPFLILIETISIIIRPLTLTVRLVANISAGHIVMSLIANCLSAFLLTFNGNVLFLVVLMYTLFEIFVGLIQAYIFTLLISLYLKEHPFV